MRYRVRFDASWDTVYEENHIEADSIEEAVEKAEALAEPKLGEDWGMYRVTVYDPETDEELYEHEM